MTAVFYPINVAAVAFASSLQNSGPFLQTARGLLLNSPLESALGYMSFGLLGSLLARLYVLSPPGSIALAAFVVPLLFFARVTFLHIREARAESARAQQGERRVRRLAQQVSDERADERLKLAGLLHDELIPVFEAINLLVGSAKNLAGATSSDPDLEPLLQNVREAGKRGGELVRNVVAGLRTSIGDAGLQGAIEGLGREGSPGVPAVRALVTFEGSMSPEEELLVFQIAREAVVNAVQHSRSDEVRVVLSGSTEHWLLSVRDDGVGFAPHSKKPDHFGLDFMTERAARLNAELAIEQVSSGTEVRLSGGGGK